MPNHYRSPQRNQCKCISLLRRPFATLFPFAVEKELLFFYSLVVFEHSVFPLNSKRKEKKFHFYHRYGDDHGNSICKIVSFFFSFLLFIQFTFFHLVIFIIIILILNGILNRSNVHFHGYFAYAFVRNISLKQFQIPVRQPARGREKYPENGQVE